jgi:hypothetical protein
MSGMLSDYLCNALLDHITGVATYTSPTQINVALFTARGSIAQSCAGTNFTEVAGGAYARVNVGITGVNWDSAASRAIQNKLLVTFPTPTADWGTVIAVGYYDQLGNLLWWDDVTSRFCALGATVTIAIGAIDLSLPYGS